LQTDDEPHGTIPLGFETTITVRL